MANCVVEVVVVVCEVYEVVVGGPGQSWVALAVAALGALGCLAWADMDGNPILAAWKQQAG